MRHNTRTFLALCAAGPLLLAASVSAGPNDDYQPPSPMTTSDKYEEAASPIYKDEGMSTEVYPETSESSTEETPEPTEIATPEPTAAVESSSAPTPYYEETTSEGGMEKTPVDTMGDDGEEEEEEEEATPMEDPEADGGGGGGSSSCSSYDEDTALARSLPEACAYNTWMCCWTGHDGQSTMYANADVCRVLDYPEEGEVMEMPRDDEGPTYCHGIAWEDGADIDTHILPLVHYVKNVNRTEDGGGYYGNILGSPECDCVENMPVVSDAACSRFGGEGIRDCYSSTLRNHYKYGLDEPKGELETNLVRECDNYAVPDYDYDSCEYNTFMCCWTENDGNGMADNTDVCRVGDIEYPGDSEGEVHCHGFTWPEGATDKYIHLLSQFVVHFDHTENRGYFGNLPGAPMCACIEDMPEVSEADCTTYDEEEGREGKFTACTNNDLATDYEETFDMPIPVNLVGECDNAEG